MNQLFISFESGKPTEIWTLSRGKSGAIPTFWSFEVTPERIRRLQGLQGRFEVQFLYNDDIPFCGERVSIVYYNK